MGSHNATPERHRIALITTTINVPANLTAWWECLDPEQDIVIVIGDQKTPEVDVVAFLDTLPGMNVYYGPATQDELYPVLSKLLGWNNIQRRNLGTLEALRRGARVILTVDDDNWPVTPLSRNVGDTIANLLDPNIRLPLRTGRHGWHNVTSALDTASMNDGPVWHRGFPHSIRDVYGSYTPVAPVRDNGSVGVLAMLWIGDPDVDALDRYRSPTLRTTDYLHAGNVTLDTRSTWCPFNSQATAFRAELAPALLYWPFVGRYDDIWASYVAQHVMREFNLNVSFGRPLVTQEREEHTTRDFDALIRDLSAEMFGMKHNDEIIRAIRTYDLNDVPSTDVVTLVERLFYHVANTCDFIPDDTVKVFDEWIRLVKEILL